MPTTVELYEALKDTVGNEAARMIADAIPQAADLATKVDIASLREGMEQLRGEIHAAEARITRWMLTFFIPLWAGVWATVLAIVLKI